MLTAPAQASTLFGSERSMCRRGGGLQRRAWSQEAWFLMEAWRSLRGGVARPGSPAGPRRRWLSLALSFVHVVPEPLGALRSAAVLGSPQPGKIPATQLRNHVQAGAARARGDYGVPGDVGA